MKSWNEYTFADWRHLRPLTHWIKTRRYRQVNQLYIRRSARAGDPVQIHKAICGRKILVTIAFGDLEVITWQARLLRRYVPHALYVIVDNSPNADVANSIAAFAEHEQLLYVRLPENPWEAASRSHGIALNWVWKNILLPGEPEAFGFLDDDLFPTTPTDPFAPLATQSFYGVVRPAGRRWFLWAGFCFYRFAHVREKPLDFGQDWFNGLDTGGGNWRVLYQHLERASQKEAQTAFVPYKSGITIEEGPLQWCDGWLHEVGIMGREDLKREKRQIVAEILSPHLEQTDRPSVIEPTV